ncbi:MAG: cation:proton antiporter subunit C [Thermoplasmata archaeon]
MTILVGLYGMTRTKNSIKMMMCLGIMGSGLILLFVSTGYIPGGGVPIVGHSPVMVDPIPHTVMLTAIVIDLATTALGLALVYHLHQEYGTLDVTEYMGGEE